MIISVPSSPIPGFQPSVATWTALLSARRDGAKAFLEARGVGISAVKRGDQCRNVGKNMEKRGKTWEKRGKTWNNMEKTWKNIDFVYENHKKIGNFNCEMEEFTVELPGLHPNLRVEPTRLWFSYCGKMIISL